MVAGIIIGASIFVQPSEITRRVPSISGMLLVWLLAGVLTLFGALICAELASAFPRTGGVYVFFERNLPSRRRPHGDPRWKHRAVVSEGLRLASAVRAARAGPFPPAVSLRTSAFPGSW